MTPNACSAIHDAAECSLLGVVSRRIESGAVLGERLVWRSINSRRDPDRASDYVACRVPDWRVTFEEPADMAVGPMVPKDGAWAKLVTTDPS